MSNLEVFLSKLTNHELSIFIGYRYNGFMEGSKEKIKKEAAQRNLSTEEIKRFLKTQIASKLETSNISCQKCGSQRLFIETDYEDVVRFQYLTAEMAIDTNRCRLCGYNPDKETPRNLIETIKRLFISNKKARFIKWKSF